MLLLFTLISSLTSEAAWHKLLSWACKPNTVSNVDKLYNLSLSLSPVYSILYISFIEADKLKTCNVLAVDDAWCERQFARVSDVTLLPPRAKAETLAVAVACGAPN